MRKSSISETFQPNVFRNFFEMHMLYIIWLYAFQVISCKFASSGIWCYFAESNWQFISICSCLNGGCFFADLNVRGSVVSV